jgi:hypothetical protein
MSTFEQKSGSVPSAQPTIAAPTVQGPSVVTNNTTYRLPCDATLQNATKLSIVEDKPVMFDYWTDSLDKKALIGVREGSQEKLLVKSAEEYTSPISKFYKSMTEYIVITENSIYVVAGDIPTRKIS